MCQFVREKSQGTLLQTVWSFGMIWKRRVKENNPHSLSPEVCQPFI